MLKCCTVSGIAWLLSHERYLRPIREVSNDHIVTTLMLSVLKRPDSAVVLGMLNHTYQCKAFTLQSLFYQKSASREMLVSRILEDDQTNVLLSNLFAALQCRAPAAAIECQPCKSGQRRWNILRQIVIEIKDVGGCIVSAKTIKWIRAVAVCLSFGPNLAHVDDAYLKIIVALALSAPDDVVLDAKVILDKCADRITCCEQDCILVAASRMCIPRKSANDLLRRFVSKMNERFPGYDEHITTGKCHRFDIPLQFFSARKLTYDIEPDYAQKLLDLDFRGGHLGTDSAINDRTFKFAGFLIDASAKFKIKLPDLNIESFQTLALMILCGTMHKYKDSMIHLNEFWRHDILWATFGILNRFIVYRDQATPESMAQIISKRIMVTGFLPAVTSATMLMLERYEWFDRNPFIACFWTELQNAISNVQSTNVEPSDGLIEIGRQFTIPPAVLFLKNRDAASKMLVGKETRHRIVTFVCAVQRAKRKNEICANDDVVYMVLSMYFGDLVRNLDTPIV